MKAVQLLIADMFGDSDDEPCMNPSCPIHGKRPLFPIERPVHALQPAPFCMDSRCVGYGTEHGHA